MSQERPNYRRSPSPQWNKRPPSRSRSRSPDAKRMRHGSREDAHYPRYSSYPYPPYAPPHNYPPERVSVSPPRTRRRSYDGYYYPPPSYYPYPPPSYAVPATSRRRRTKSRSSSPRRRDNVDSHGNKASKRLFIDRLPPDTTEDHMRKLFGNYEKSLTQVKLGTKPLRHGEYRTCIVTFADLEDAMRARADLDGYGGPKDAPYPTRLLVNFAKPMNHDNGSDRYGSSRTIYSQHDSRHASDSAKDYYKSGSSSNYPREDRREYKRRSPSPQYASTTTTTSSSNHSLTSSMSSHLERDKLGNPATHVLFVPNLAPNMTRQMVEKLFPTCKDVELKSAKPGDEIAGYIYFEDVYAAVRERHRMTAYSSPEQPQPLMVNYSTRVEDQRTSDAPLSTHSTSHTSSNNGGGSSSSKHHYSSSSSHRDNRAPSPVQVNQDDFEVDDQGNSATNALFITRLPKDYQEQDISAIFKQCAGLKRIKPGDRVSEEGFRTCIVIFNTTQEAARARFDMCERIRKEYKTANVHFHKNGRRRRYPSRDRQ